MSIKEKVELLNEQERNINSSYKAKRFLTRAGIILFGGPSVLFLLTDPLIGVPLIGLTVGLLSKYYTDYDNTVIMKNSIVKKKNNLLNLSRRNLNSTNSSQASRVKLIKELREREQLNNSNTSSNRFKSKLTSAALVGATILGVAMPGPLSFVAPALGILKIYKDRDYTNSLRESENVSQKIESLTDEYYYVKNSKNKTQVKQANNVQRVNGNAKKTVTVNKTKKSRNENIIDQYIRNLENNTSMSKGEKEMLKAYITNYQKRK